ncbi:MAG: class I SAM-dependent methyltransferase [Clostridiales bacterium]|nr:class I SAM-dependent methyltransferase [Clostridiales bacterium]
MAKVVSESNEGAEGEKTLVLAELGVGTGRIALPLSRIGGVKVYGVDSCLEMLEICRARAAGTETGAAGAEGTGATGTGAASAGAGTAGAGTGAASAGAGTAGAGMAGTAGTGAARAGAAGTGESVGTGATGVGAADTGMAGGCTPCLELILADFMAFRLPEAADAIYMPYRTIGHILTDEGLAALLAQVRLNLKPGGLFLFDHYMFDEHWAVGHSGASIVMYEDRHTRIVNRDDIDFARKQMHCTVAVNGDVIEEFDFRWLAPDTIWALLPHSGFVCEALYGDFDGSGWSETSPNQIWVLRREG